MMGVSVNREQLQSGESGFVLVTSIIMLSLLTLMSLGMYFASKSGSQTSAAAQTSTEAYYYAESAIHYIGWAIANDAEFDSFTYTSTTTSTYLAPTFAEPTVPANAITVGDFVELQNNLWDPGPTGVAGAGADDTSAAYIAGQVKYFDNSPMANRYLCLENYTLFPNCLDVSLSPGNANRVQPSMYRISAKLPRYIKLDIAVDGVITPSIPPLPHRAVPVVGEDIPLNGAIVWITAVDATDATRDIEIFPLTNNSATCQVFSPPSQCPAACAGSTVSGQCPCTAPVTADPLQNYAADPADPQFTNFQAAFACDANPLQSDDSTSPDYLATTDPNYVSPWLSSYGIAAYAIGYVNGQPSHLIRSVIR